VIIAICGFMGAGKSSFLKQYPEVDSIDIDQALETDIGALGEYIRKSGWGSFRSLEAQKILKTIEGCENDLLISLGGGALDDETNLKQLKTNNVKIIFLQQEFEICLERIKGDDNRPQLDKTEEELRALFAKREQIFKESSDFVLKGDSENWPTQWSLLKTLV
jgi:shikimate kinase